MTSRLVSSIGAAVALGAFAGGWAIARGKADGADGTTGDRSPSSTSPPSAMPSALPSSDSRHSRMGTAFSELSRSTEFGMLAKYRGYMRLIREAEVEDMPELIRRIHAELPDELGGEALLERAAMRWAELDPEGALGALLSLEPEGISEGASAIIEANAKAGPRAAFELVTEVGSANDQYRNHVLGQMLVEFARTDPQLVPELIASLEHPGSHWDGLRSGLTDIAEFEPDVAMAAFDRLPKSWARRSSVVFSAFSSYGRDDSEAGMAALERIADPTTRAEAAGALASGMAERDPQAALEWAREMAPGPVRVRAELAALSGFAENEPVGASAIVTDLASPELRNALAPDVVEAWVNRDGALEALAWAQENLEGEARESALDRLLREVDDGIDFETQRQIAEEIPDGEGAAEFAERWAEDDPAAAAAWALTQPRSRELFHQVAREWRRDDREAYEEYLTGLSAGQVDRIDPRSAERRQSLMSEEP